jgi:oligopeptidase B
MLLLGKLLVQKSSSFLVPQVSRHSRQQQLAFATTTTSLRMSSSTAKETKTIAPPVARRDEDGHILAGKLSPSDPGYWTDKEQTKPLIRQSVGSKEPLLDPPVKISDPYGWMRDETRTNQEVLDHLEQENAYTEQLTSHLGDLRGTIYDEMVAGIKETDHTVPSARKDGYLYYSRTFAGKSYRSHCRAPLSENEDWVNAAKAWDGSADSPILPGEVSYLDVNQLAEGRKYCAAGAIKTSPPNAEGKSEFVAYTVDFSGNEVTELFVKNIATGEIIDNDPDLECYGSVQWGADDKTLFYMKMDEQQRPYQLYRRIIGSGEPDELLYQDDDELYWVHFSKSFDGKFIFVSSGSKETSESHFLDLTDPDAKLQCVAKRRKKVLYYVDHRAGYWYISTNVGGSPNMKLMVSEAVADSEEQWKDMMFGEEKLFDGGYDRSIDALESFQSHSVAIGREGGLPQVWVIGYDGETSSEVNSFVQLTFDEDAFDVGLGANLDCTADSVVVAYDSLVTPLSHIKIPLNAPTDLEARTVLKEQEVPGYDKSQYSCERVTVPSRDGETEIPVSIVYRSETMDKIREEGVTVPTHLYGYGSYSACMEASFSTTRRALLDRGMVYVIAHVRGGGEMGRQWYEEPKGAKYLCKKNTFNDFVDVGRWLTEDRKITTPQQLSCEGRSAGGLLIGASINQAPELFKAALLGVPFVDVVPTMIDASIPLTIVEWEEWGNPNEEKYHQYMMEYSPINNVQSGATYPSCLLTGGLHDPRVQYWEPSKFAAEIRHQSDSETSGPCCIKIDMAAGHFSASDRYKYLKELAFDYAFLLDQLGLAE